MSLDKKSRIDEIAIKHDDTILHALKRMDETFKRLLLIFEGQQFVNVLSIGDIQRAIIQNISLNTSVSEILRKDTKVGHLNDSVEIIKQQMLEFRAECMPVVDDHHMLVDVYFWDDIFPAEEKKSKTKIDVPIVIMAGGKGVRMRPLTNVIPKPLIPIGEKTILENIMDRFLEIGSNQFYLTVNYKSEIIDYYLNSLNHPEYKIELVEETKPLGTAGGLYLLKEKINKTFFVSNCDIIIEEDYTEMYNYHKDNKNDLTIVAALKHYQIPYGTIETGEDGILKWLDEKPELTLKINSGMYILEPQLLEMIPENMFFHITDLIDNVRRDNGKVGVFPVSERSWMDIGNWNEYLANFVKI